jgi:hypothetical protein
MAILLKRPDLLAACAAFVCLVPLLPICAETSDDRDLSRVWPSEPPADIPFKPSKELRGIEFTGRHAEYSQADTWFPSWADNGNLYSPWTDGGLNGMVANSAALRYEGGKETTGYATILGDDPLNLKIVGAGMYHGSPAPYGGRYPAGSLVYDGIWYYGTYCLYETPGVHLNWDTLGPLVGFRHSTDYGKTWQDTKHTPASPLFNEPAKFAGKVKLGNPHFVDFGRNMQYSPDGKAYLVSHGASDPDSNPRTANLSWITGDQIFLARVKPDIHNMDDASKYEFFSGNDPSGRPRWTSDFSQIQPLLEWNNNMGCVTVTYNAPLKKYLMAITDGGNTVSKYNTYILESGQITGPWKLVTYLRAFGEQAYFVNFPSKFISKDGRTAWLSYSANYTNGDPKRFGVSLYDSKPAGGSYSWTLQEVRLVGP